MNAATAVFLIFILLFASFAGLGYVANQIPALRDEINSCKQNTAALEQQAAQLRSDLVSALAHVDDLTKRMGDLQIQNSILTNELSVARAYSNDLSKQLKDTEEKIKVQEKISLQQSTANQKNLGLEVMATPVALVFLLLLGGKAWQIRSQPQNKNRMVTLQLTREQVKGYLRYTRQQNSQ